MPHTADQAEDAGEKRAFEQQEMNVARKECSANAREQESKVDRADRVETVVSQQRIRAVREWEYR